MIHSCILKYNIHSNKTRAASDRNIDASTHTYICPDQATVAQTTSRQSLASERQRTNRRREMRVGQLAQAEQGHTHLVVFLQLECAPREHRAHAPRLVQRVAVGVVQDHKLRRRHAEHVRAVVAPTPLSHHVIAAACARASTSLSAREHAHNQQPHVIVRAGADAGAGCVVRVSGLRTASHSQGALQPSLIASTDRCARRAGCTPVTRSSHAKRTRPGQRRSCADEAPVRNAATCHGDRA